MLSDEMSIHAMFYVFVSFHPLHLQCVLVENIKLVMAMSVCEPSKLLIATLNYHEYVGMIDKNIKFVPLSSLPLQMGNAMPLNVNSIVFSIDFLNRYHL